MQVELGYAGIEFDCSTRSGRAVPADRARWFWNDSTTWNSGCRAVERAGLSTSTSRSNGTSACAKAARSAVAGRGEQLGERGVARRPAVRSTRVLTNMPISSSSSASPRPAIGVPTAISAVPETLASRARLPAPTSPSAPRSPVAASRARRPDRHVRQHPGAAHRRSTRGAAFTDLLARQREADLAAFAQRRRAVRAPGRGAQPGPLHRAAPAVPGGLVVPEPRAAAPGTARPDGLGPSTSTPA